MKKKIPIGYYIYIIVSLIIAYIGWKNDNGLIMSILGGFFLGIPTTFIIVIFHAFIERMK